MLWVLGSSIAAESFMVSRSQRRSLRLASFAAAVIGSASGDARATPPGPRHPAPRPPLTVTLNPTGRLILPGPVWQQPVAPVQYEVRVPAVPPQGLPTRTSPQPIAMSSVPPVGGDPSALPTPRTVSEAMGLTPSLVESEPLTVVEVSLVEALAMAGGQSPQIAFAAARLREAYADHEAARVLWLPSLRAGVSYNRHDGNLQASDGQVLDVNRSALNPGLGLGATGAGTPVLPGVYATFKTADAVFEPSAARYTVAARKAGTRVATNDTLLDTALAYQELLAAHQEVRIAEETKANANTLADLTGSFARTGQGPQADADRARAELARRANDVSRAGERAAVAAAGLAELVRLPPGLPVVPREPAVVPLELVSADAPVGDLVGIALANRPELAEAKHLAARAAERGKQAKYSPFLPSVALGFSQGGFGGGRVGRIADVNGRVDFDAAVYWEVRNLGLGERADRNRTRAVRDQAVARQVQVMDRIAREVVAASARVTARRGQIEVAAGGVGAAETALKRDTQRLREGVGLPIELLQSVQALDSARREYLRAVVDYNAAQFQLHRALGWAIH